MTDVKRLLDELDGVIERAAYTRVDQETTSHLVGLCKRSAQTIRSLQESFMPGEMVPVIREFTAQTLERLAKELRK